MSDNPPATTFWFRVGYALERARQTVSARGATSPRLAPADSGDEERPEVHPEGGGPSGATPPPHPDQLRGRLPGVPRDPFLDVGAAWLERKAVSRLIQATGTRRFDLVRAALAGAGAELASIALHAILRGPEVDPPQTDGLATLAGGAADGMVYASMVRPLVPGPLWLRGSAFGVARYLAARGGGLPFVLGSLSPHRQIMGFHALLKPRDQTDDTVVEHLAAGVVLAALYESSDWRRGITPDGTD